MKKHVRILTYPAPSRCWRQEESGKWRSERWTFDDVVNAKEGGAWFQKGRHEFADLAAAKAAGEAE